MKAIAKYQQKVISCVNDVSESIADMFTKVDKQLSKIHDKLSSNKVSWLAIVAGLSLVLIPLFWDKIKGFFSSLSQKFDLDKMINGAISKVIKTVDWNKHVSVILGKVLTAVLEALSDAVANPFDMITKKFIIAYEAMIEWTNDIWAYVKDELSWTKQKQDENEQKAEQESS